MLVNLRRAVLVSVVFFVLLGLAYPLAETGIGQAFFSHQANGSLTKNGSTLVGQAWAGPKWFQGRPDADNPMATGGSNLGPRSKVLVTTVKKQIALLRREGSRRPLISSPARAAASTLTSRRSTPTRR